VRSAAEAEIALAGGADLIDIKEPRRGALGPADSQVWEEVRRLVGDRVPVSAALGELLASETVLFAGQSTGMAYAKIGLAGCLHRPDWILRWRNAARALPRGTAVVPVAYADWQAAGAPSPRVAVALAQWTTSRLALIDTFDKTAGGLLDHLTREYLEELTGEAREVGVELVLAGSLDRAAIESLRELAPRYFGVRGAACAGGREGAIELARVKSLSRLVRGKPTLRPR
jgi:uncharacterized protein (UPF0264 family)